MRVGIGLPPGDARRMLELGAAADEHGLDLVLVEDTGPGAPAPFVVAAAVGAASLGTRLVVDSEVGGVHPVAIAEDAAVADLASGGRLVLAARPTPGLTAPELAVDLDLLLAACRARPFRHAGPRWPTPANLEHNRFNLEERLRVTPAPAQLELPVWVRGVPDVAASLGLSPLVDLDDGARAWAGDRSPRRTRPALVDAPLDARRPGGRLDVDGLVTRLRAAQRDWGLDAVVLRPGAGLDDAGWHRLARALAGPVKARVQLDRLPEGLEEHWRRHVDGRESHG